jgi:predicted transcriptional regulator
VRISILLSVKPEFAEAILDGQKTFEFRRRVFRNQAVRRVVLYASAPVQRVVGEFTIADVLCMAPRALWQATKSGSGINRDYFDAYFVGRDTAYALQVARPKRYRRPLGLREHFGISRPPQSFQYVGSED